MGIWVEIRCENRAAESARGEAGSHCWSHENQGPMGEASDKRAKLIELMRGLEQEARTTGWIKTRKGWMCPFCADIPGINSSQG